MLREYQQKVVREVYGFYRGGIKSVLVYAPTGAGKTHISSAIIADALKKSRRVLFLVHRTKLIEQTVNTLTKAYAIKLDQIGVIAPGYEPSYGCPIQIAMLQTIAKRKHLPQEIGLVILDEAHTTAYYSTFRRIQEYYSNGLTFLSKCMFLGLSATPWRTKKSEGFCTFFQAIVRAPYPQQLIDQGHLVEARHFGYNGLIDYSQLESKDGEFTQSSLELVCGDELNESVVEKFLEVCPTRKAIAFCASVKQAQNLAEQFNAANIPSEVISGDLPEPNRNAIYRRFKHGDTQIITSVAVLTEGFDEPSCDCAIVARPTKSRALWVQMAGRALRLFEGKKDAFILDFGENCQRLKLSTAKHKTPLCAPKEPQEGEAPMKTCPVCQSLVPNFAKICPVCGHIFEKEPEPEGGEDAVFGEILSDEEKEKVTYLRTQVIKAWRAKRSVPRVFWLFAERFGHSPKERYYYNCIFRMPKNPHPNLVEANKQEYIKYLKTLKPNAPDGWLHTHLRREFGDRYYRQLQEISWWDILEVPELCGDWSKIAFSYGRKILEVNSPQEAALLNFAIDEATEYFRVKNIKSA